MNRIQTILSCLEGNAKDFTSCCDIRAFSPDIKEEIDKAVEQGEQMVDNIQEVLAFMEGIRARLEVSDG